MKPTPTPQGESALLPEQARHYIATFAKHIVPGTDRVRFANGDEVFFANMTDEEAVRVAHGLMDIEAQAAARRKGVNNA